MIKFRDDIDVLELLRRSDFTTYRLRREHVLGESTIQRLRRRELPSWRELDIICEITAYDVGELIEHVSDHGHES